MPLLARVTPIARLARPNADYVRPWFGLWRAAEYLRRRGLSVVPVVNGEGRPVGLLFRERASALVGTSNAPETLLVCDAMTQIAAVARPGMTVANVVAEVIGGLPGHTPPLICTVDEDGVLDGVVPVNDVMRWLAHAAPSAA